MIEKCLPANIGTCVVVLMSVLTGLALIGCSGGSNATAHGELFEVEIDGKELVVVNKVERDWRKISIEINSAYKHLPVSGLQVGKKIRVELKQFVSPAGAVFDPKLVAIKSVRIYEMVFDDGNEVVLVDETKAPPLPQATVKKELKFEKNFR